MSQPTAFADPPIGADGLIDVFAFATRVPGSPEVRPSGIDLAALDAATPAAPVGPLGLPAEPTTAAAVPARPKVEDHERLVNEVAMEQPGDPDLPEGAVRVDLLDPKGENVIGTFVVLGGDDWPSRVTPWMRDPMQWHDWAMAVLATDDDRDLWMALDPTNRQTARFIDALLVATGSVPAKKGQR